MAKSAKLNLVKQTPGLSAFYTAQPGDGAAHTAAAPQLADI